MDCESLFNLRLKLYMRLVTTGSLTNHGTLAGNVSCSLQPPGGQNMHGLDCAKFGIYLCVSSASASDTLLEAEYELNIITS